eukprot:scaffold2404_cov398-Prasinococcus_capsulatus_cf.AAC.17
MEWAQANQDKLHSLVVLNSPISENASFPLVLNQLRTPLVASFVAQVGNGHAVGVHGQRTGGHACCLSGCDDARKWRLRGGADGGLQTVCRRAQVSSPAWEFLVVLSLLIRSLPLPRAPTPQEYHATLASGFAKGSWRVPTVVAWGTEDKYLGASEADALKACNPEAVEVQLIDGAGHQVQEDYAERVLGAVRRVLLELALCPRPPRRRPASSRLAAHAPHSIRRRRRGCNVAHHSIRGVGGTAPAHVRRPGAPIRKGARARTEGPIRTARGRGLLRRGPPLRVIDAAR